MTSLEIKYGFPLFTRNANNVYLGNSKKLIISDIWSFWDYIIKKNNYEKPFMNSLLEQAKYFYFAAESSPIRSKPLLYYYSFLNLSKVIVNIEKKYGITTYLHGLGETHNHRFIHSTIKVAEIKTGVKNVSAELLRVLDNTSLTASQTINVRDLMMHCVGVHRAYSEIYNVPEVFFRLDEMQLFKDRKDVIAKFKVQCSNSDIASLQATGYNLIEDDGVHYWEERITQAGYSITRNSYYQLSQRLRSLGMWYFIGDNGYTTYISNHLNNRYSPEFIIYNTMFFLGSITRYHPYMFDKIFSDKEQWLMSEFLTTQPKQFLYLATAKILGQSVNKAYSSF